MLFGRSTMCCAFLLHYLLFFFAEICYTLRT